MSELPRFYNENTTSEEVMVSKNTALRYAAAGLLGAAVSASIFAATMHGNEQEQEPIDTTMLTPLTTAFVETTQLTTEVTVRDPSRPTLFSGEAQFNGYTFLDFDGEYVDASSGVVCNHTVWLGVGEDSVSAQLEALRVDWEAHPEELPGGHYDSVPFATHLAMTEAINRDLGFEGSFDDVQSRSQPLWFPVCTNP